MGKYYTIDLSPCIMRHIDSLDDEEPDAIRDPNVTGDYVGATRCTLLMSMYDLYRRHSAMAPCQRSIPRWPLTPRNKPQLCVESLVVV